ncbi:nuclear transport factor 2 family protein [Dyella sp.]|uniref:nuclear transport factor 2 family protein n=1 Tax=Dyella sp. TaxID=1869338 RepID=UPI002ED53CEF
MSIESVARRLVELCRAGQFEAAQRELYAQDAESLEPPGAQPGALGSVKGLDAILKKGQAFQDAVDDLHRIEVSDPLVAGQWFSITMTLDVTMKQHGRQLMTEICVYHVKDDKVISEQFFYDMG